MLVIPAIDLKQGQCVRLRQGEMDQASVFSDDPVLMAQQWARQGARRLHLVDLDGAFAAKPVNREIIEGICRALPDLPIQVGGGIRNLKTIETYLNAGVYRVIIGTQAVKAPEFVRQACEAFADRIIVGIDAREGKVATEGWANTTDMSALSLIKQFESVGVSEVIFTDIGRDGMMQGLNAAATAQLAQQIRVPVIASGGVTDLEDIRTLCQVAPTGICGVISGRAIYEGTLDLQAAQALADQLTGIA